MKSYRFWHNFFGHLKTITHHKKLVLMYCFKCGMIKQGLLHDLSKYSPSEFWPGVRYYQEGKSTPLNAEKREKGYSLASLHHIGRNKHHWKYWVDQDVQGQLTANTMPEIYLLESVLDRLAASKTYNRNSFQNDTTYRFFLNSTERHYMNPTDVERTDELLRYYAENGEKKTFEKIKGLYKQAKHQEI